MSKSGKHSHGHHHEDHPHHHGLGQYHHGNIANIRTAFLLNFLFTLIEIAGGILSNSVALLSDAIHDLGDSLSLGFAWFAEKKADQELKDERFTFGMNRLPLISAVVNAVVLTAGSIFIILHSIERFQHPEPIDYRIMIPLAVLGVIVNGWAVVRLAKNQGINSKVMRLHLLEDILGWVALLFGAIIMFFTDWFIIDPILSLGIAAFILFNAVKNLRHAYFIVMQCAPEGICVGDVKNSIIALPEVDKVMDFHFWTLEGSLHVMSVHILIHENLPTADLIKLKNKIRGILKAEGDIHTTIEIEFPEEEECEDHC